MNWVAIRMLTGDRVKFFGLVFGVTFATFLMSQQVSVFVGIVGRSASQIVDVRDASIWVMDPRVRHFDEAPGLPHRRPAARARRRGRAMGRAVLQGAGAGPRRTGLAAQRDPGSGRRRQPGRCAAGIDRRRPGRPAPPLRGDRRQGRLRISLARRADPPVARVRDQRSPRGAGRRLQGVASVRHAAGDVHPVQRGAALRPDQAQPDELRAGRNAAGPGGGRSQPSGSRDRPACWRSRRSDSSGTRSTTCSARPAFRSISASRSRWVSSSAWPWPGRRSTCSRSKT